MRTSITVAITVLVTLAVVGVFSVATSITGKTKVVTVTTIGRPSAAAGYVIAGVVDGSTLRLNNGQMLGLRDVDSPEPDKECYGDESRRALERLAQPGTTAWVLAGSSVERGTAVSGYVVVDGVFLNVELARQGAVAPYFGEQAGSFSRVILRAAREAFDGRQGLWSCPGAHLDPHKPVETGRA